MKTIALIFIISSSLFAHKLNIFISQENQVLYVNAYFASGKPCQKCQVEVLNAQNLLLSKGITNAKGDFEIKKFEKNISVSVDAGSGHKQVREFVAQMNHSSQKNELQLVRQLREENARLKREIELLKEKSSLVEIGKILLALMVIGGIFFALKRVKK